MCKYKGNTGNLMQHWTLCEILTVLAAADCGTSCLSYVDAHAMAPWATKRDQSCQTFDRVRGSLGEFVDEQSVYEQAWHRLTQGREAYPNSAAFVEDIWKGQVSMLLCEIDPSTAAKVTAWAQGRTERTEVTVIEDDWRRRFEAGLPDAPITLLSFDP